MRKGPETHHVVPNPNGGWDVKRDGGERSSKHFDRKSDAVNWGREVIRHQETEFRIHNRSGRISKSDSHGNDPNPPKDKN